MSHDSPYNYNNTTIINTIYTTCIQYNQQTSHTKITFKREKLTLIITSIHSCTHPHTDTPTHRKSVRSIDQCMEYKITKYNITEHVHEEYRQEKVNNGGTLRDWGGRGEGGRREGGGGREERGEGGEGGEREGEREMEGEGR